MKEENALRIDEFDEIFRIDSSGRFSEDTRSKLQQKFWSENESEDPISPSNRCICWRYLLGILSPCNVNNWVEDLNFSVVKYTNFKKEIFPSISNVGFDPLSDNNPDTVSYFESVEKVKAIELDLNRLYMNGIDEEYFHTKRRNSILQSVLLIWSVQNPSISYRQGMHEIVGSILHCLERELEAWTSSSSFQQVPEHFLRGALSEETVEAHTYWIFTSVLQSLGVLYDPTLLPPVDAASITRSDIDDALRPVRKEYGRAKLNNSVPRAVLYLTDFQGKHLRNLDPDLWEHLSTNDIHPQFYGLRWARLLLGREFHFSDTHVLRIWDCLFCACMVKGLAGEERASDSLSSAVHCEDDLDHINISERSVIAGRHNSSSSIVTDGNSSSDFTESTAYSPMLVALREFMLAMLIYIREEILAGDSSAILGLLMKFPEMESLSPIFRIVQDLRSGRKYAPRPSSNGIQKGGLEATSVLSMYRNRKEETWDDPVQPDAAVCGAPHSSDLPPFEPLCATSPPSSWLSAALDFKNHLTIPSLSSFKPLSDFERGGDADGRAADSMRLLNGQSEGQEMEGTIPFLSPFPPTAHPMVSLQEPSPSPSPSSSRGAVSAQNSVLRSVDLDSTERGDQHAHSTEENREEDEGEEDVFYGVAEDVSESGSASSSVTEQRAVQPAKVVGGHDIASPQLVVNSTAANATISSSPEKNAKTIIPGAEGGGGEAAPSPSPSVLPVLPEDLGFISRNEKEVDAASISGGGIRVIEMKEELGLLFTSAPSRFASSLEFLIGDSSLKKSKGGVFSGITSSFVSDDEAGADKGKSKITVPSMRPSLSESDCSEVGDRLLAIAEHLLSIEHPVSCADNTLQGLQQAGGEEEGNAGPSEADKGLRESLTAENRLRTDTAKKLLLLAKVLSGRYPMSEYRALYDEAA